jgi:hypothetical protein
MERSTMAPQEIRVPFPLDMMGDLDTTLRYVEDRHLVDPQAVAKDARFHPLAAAVHAIKSAIHAYRAKAAAEAVSFDHIPLERSHLATLLDFAPEPGHDAHRAAGNVSEWLDRDI